MKSSIIENKDGWLSINNHKIRWLKGGKDYFELINSLIDDARESIYLYAYIIKNDQTGNAVIESLINASIKGVKVHLMCDGFASRKLSKSIIQKMKTAGINFKFFNPLFSLPYLYMGRRMHLKVLTMDNKTAVVGGINIADRYNDMPEQPAWLDFALLIKGAMVGSLTAFCKSMWNDKFRSEHFFAHQQQLGNNAMNLPQIAIRYNDWLFRKKEITTTYENMFQDAKSEIIILCSYFIPGNKLRKRMADASSRGVKISVITAGLSDVPITKAAERWLYDWMFRNKIKVYEYQKSVLHGKAALCDQQWITIGSYNINNISAYASVELNIDVNNSQLAEIVSEDFSNVIKHDCVCITPEQHQNGTGPIKQLSRWCAYQLIRVILNLFTFFFPKKN